MPNFFMPRFPFYNYRPYRTTPKPHSTPNASSYQKILPPSLDNSPCSSDYPSDTRQSDYNDILNKKDPIFEIFGIKLFFDDILILSLLFFLYSEGVKDEMLFISLILLLLS